MGPWKEMSKAKPERFDLCRMELGDGSIVRGWWDGNRWEGLRYKGQEVKRWRHIHYDE